MNRRDFIIKTSGAVAVSLTYSQLYAKIHKKIEQIPHENTYDVIVLGVGSMGASTCYHLAIRGYKVLGLEQFDITHELGSHAGQSRIIRKAYGEASDYVPLLERAYQNWKTLEEETGYQVYYDTGLVYFGSKEDAFLNTVKKSSKAYNITVNELSEEACSAKYPQFKLPSEFQRLEEPDAGLLTPERSILLMVQQALFNGAVVKTKEKVLGWNHQNSVVTVTTNKGTYLANKLVITSGAWTSKLISNLEIPLKITRQALAWVQPKKWDDFTLGKFPCWLLEHGDYDFYGFPILPVGSFGGPLGLKLALHYPNGEVTDPDQVNRNTKESDENVLIQFLNEFMPDGYKSTLEMKTCLYTISPDQNFILDFVSGHDKNVVMAAGFSGHGFKFASVIGEIMADLAIHGKTALPIEFLSTRRFG